MITTPVTEWEKQPEWHGNPSLGFDCWKRVFKVKPSGRKVPIYLYGEPDSLELTYVVSAGHDSDLSHSGSFYPEKLTWGETMERIDQRSNEGKLIY